MGDIVGNVSGGPQRESVANDYERELYNLLVLWEFQGPGIDSALFEQMMALFC